MRLFDAMYNIRRRQVPPDWKPLDVPETCLERPADSLPRWGWRRMNVLKQCESISRGESRGDGI